MGEAVISHTIAPDNTRDGKRALLYDGHNRSAGVAAKNDTAHWRHIRRAVKRWLVAQMEDW